MFCINFHYYYCCYDYGSDLVELLANKVMQVVHLCLETQYAAIMRRAGRFHGLTHPHEWSRLAGQRLILFLLSLE